MGGGLESSEIARADLKLMHDAAQKNWSSTQTSERWLATSLSLTLISYPVSEESLGGATRRPHTAVLAIGEGRSPGASTPADGRIWLMLVPSVANQLRGMPLPSSSDAPYPKVVSYSNSLSEEFLLPPGAAVLALEPGARGVPPVHSTGGRADWGESVAWLHCAPKEPLSYSPAEEFGAMLRPDGCLLAVGAPSAFDGQGAI